MMDGKQFLGTARFLRHKGTDEAAFRSAVSRAYYACFIVTRDVAYSACCNITLKKKAGIINEAKVGHQPLRNYLESSSKPEVKMLAADLAGLSGNRNDADYKMNQKITEYDAQSAIEEAEAYLKALSEIPSVDIGKAMEAFLKTTNP